MGSLKFVSRPMVYTWGNGTTLPLLLPPPSDVKVVGVACGRSQKTGITEDGKLFLWQVYYIVNLLITSKNTLYFCYPVFIVTCECCCHDAESERAQQSSLGDDDQVNYGGILGLHQKSLQW